MSLTADWPRRLLQPGERLLWQGAPRRPLRLRDTGAGDLLTGVVGLAVLAVAFSAQAGLWVPQDDIVRFLPFVALGGVWALSQPLISLWRLARTRYALTDRRPLLFWATPFRHSTDSLWMTEIQPILVPRTTGDTLLLGWYRPGQGDARPRSLTRFWRSGDDGERRFAFERIADGEAVLALVHQHRMALP